MNNRSFIKETAKRITAEHSVKEIEEAIFVFPNRRAGLFFQRELSLALRGMPIFLPEVYDINRFAESLSTYRKAEEVELLLYLHKAYRDVYNNACEASLPLRSFIELGMKMLHDFDEVDKYLVDVHKLFVNISQLSELTATMELSEEQKEAIARFCNIVQGDARPCVSTGDRNEDENKLEFHRKYASLWNHIIPIYDRFQEILEANKAAYEGKIYREVCEVIPTDRLPQKSVYFIGFNILTASEETLIHRFEERGLATLIFDYNAVERTTAAFNYHHSINDFKFERPKEIYDYPSMTSGEQADNLHDILQGLIESSSASEIERNTAIVLADESMLVQALHAIPEEIEHLNITMGYPLADTPIATFIGALIQYQVNISVDTTGVRSIYHRHLMEVLLHPYCRILCDGERINELVTRIRRENMLRMDIRELEKVDAVFRYEEDIFAYVSGVMDLLDEHFLSEGNTSLDLEFIRQYRDRLTQLGTILKRITVETHMICASHGRASIDRSDLTILIRRITRNLKVQFRGEPLKGLQIMGLLECRLLDFDHIIFVGFNDQYVPGSGINDNTLIPYSLRKPYGLPSHEITNLIYAYNFYRMLHRCKSLHLIYNLATGDNSKNEVSRFYHQLRYLYDVDINKVGLPVETHGRASHPGSSGETHVSASLPYFPETEKVNDFALSASGLKTFITCPLKFYYSYILGIKEPDQIDETMQDGTFGLLLHKIMELHYNSKDSFDKISLEAYREVCHRSYEAKGYDIIAFESAKTMARAIIEYDKTKRAPFTIAATEHKFRASYKDLKLRGIIDRMDNDNDSTWVIDYKTSGAAEELNIERMFDSAEAKLGDLENMQVLFYCYTLRSRYKHLKAQLYKVYSISKEQELPAPMEYATIAADFEPLLEQTLDRLIEALKKPQLFMQVAANDKNCEYCIYKNLCGQHL